MGWALAERGEVEKRLARIRDGLDTYRKMGAGMERPCFVALLSEACGKGGHVTEGLEALEEALSLVSRTGMRTAGLDRRPL